MPIPEGSRAVDLVNASVTALAAVTPEWRHGMPAAFQLSVALALLDEQIEINSELAAALELAIMEQQRTPRHIEI